MYFLYIHINKINGKVYIGWSCNPQHRWGKNGIGYKGHKYFWNAIQKYGWDNFYHIIICQSSNEELIKQLEIEYIALYNSDNQEHGYNITKGGEGYNRGKGSNLPGYRKKRYQENPEHFRQLSNKYHLQNKERDNICSLAYYYEHKDDRSIKMKKWNDENKERVKAYQKEYSEKTKEKRRRYMKEYREKTKEKRRQYMKEYREKKK